MDFCEISSLSWFNFRFEISCESLDPSHSLRWLSNRSGSTLLDLQDLHADITRFSSLHNFKLMGGDNTSCWVELGGPGFKELGITSEYRGNYIPFKVRTQAGFKPKPVEYERLGRMCFETTNKWVSISHSYFLFMIIFCDSFHHWFVCVFVSVSNSLGLCLGYCWADFDETW